MALPELRGTGRLITDPRHGTTKTDQPYTSALDQVLHLAKVDGWEEGEGTLASSSPSRTTPLPTTSPRATQSASHGTSPRRHLERQAADRRHHHVLLDTREDHQDSNLGRLHNQRLTSRTAVPPPLTR
jgi:hypothetical protein